MTTGMFADRTDAGRRLAEALRAKKIERPVVVAILRGGVPVGVEIARGLSCPLKLIVLRKLFIPMNPEAGFGAMAPDGSVSVDEEFVTHLGMGHGDVAEVIRQVREELKHRHQIYESVSVDDVRARDAILVDDGIAAGYSMTAAARFVRTLQPRSTRIAVPCAPTDSILRVGQLVDDLLCLRHSSLFPFAVASFYQHWHDLTDDEVRVHLARLGGA
ncbi:MAG TPA: phosphoribosyltransferase family protein [Planctomycetota bacterium]|nr:phosphoribosyltransferase family protein [Planctomycetota bacterium]